MYNTQGDLRSYREILHRSRPVSRFHHPMSRQNRAAQFAPFDALTGYGAAIREMARRTEPKRTLTEEEKQRLDRQLRRLLPGTDVTVRYFVPDQRKDGGAYRRITGTVRKLDGCGLILTDGTGIPLDDLYQIEIQEPELFPDSCEIPDFSV